MTETFEAANRFWNMEGRTAAALDLYARASAESPDDPVVAFQHALALWATDRFDEAAGAVRRALGLADRLGEEAEDLVALAEPLARPTARNFPELPATLLDRDRLSARGDDLDWRAVADAASQRQMHGVATYALERWRGVPVDAEDARELDAIEAAGSAHESVLRELSAALGRTQAGAGHGGPGSVHGNQTMDQVVLEVEVLPDLAPVGTPTLLRHTLTNRSADPVRVNGRMLANSPGRPGELFTDLDGPPGYVELAGVRINVGEAHHDSFVNLAPGERLTGTFPLDRFHSLHLAGEYVLRVDYRNDVARTTDGRPVLVGHTSARVTFRRTD